MRNKREKGKRNTKMRRKRRRSGRNKGE